jgi:hypothetical protein
MSDVRRAYDLLRGYVGREWDRIKDIEWAEAAKELLLPAGDPASTTDPQAQPTETEPAPAPTTDYRTLARQILGVTPDADFATIRQAFEKLNGRTNPTLFPAGSDEAAQAAKLREKVTWAYQFLTAGTDETQKRFGSLEIE